MGKFDGITYTLFSCDDVWYDHDESDEFFDEEEDEFGLFDDFMSWERWGKRDSIWNNTFLSSSIKSSLWLRWLILMKLIKTPIRHTIDNEMDPTIYCWSMKYNIEMIMNVEPNTRRVINEMILNIFSVWNEFSNKV